MSEGIVARVLGAIRAIFRFIFRLIFRWLADLTGIPLILWMVRYFGQRDTGRPFSWLLLLADIFRMGALVLGLVSAVVLVVVIFGGGGGGYALVAIFGLVAFTLLSLLLWLLFRFLARRISGISSRDRGA